MPDIVAIFRNPWLLEVPLSAGAADTDDGAFVAARLSAGAGGAVSAGMGARSHFAPAFVKAMLYLSAVSALRFFPRTPLHNAYLLGGRVDWAGS